jgi:hypothetical protein
VEAATVLALFIEQLISVGRGRQPGCRKAPRRFIGTGSMLRAGTWIAHLSCKIHSHKCQFDGNTKAVLSGPQRALHGDSASGWKSSLNRQITKTRT